MKIHKISLIAVLVAATVLAYSPALRAQEKEKKDAPKREGRPGGPMSKERLDKMAEDLKLTADQKTKVEAAMKEQGEKMRALREDTSLSDEQRREKFRSMRDEMDKKMKDILTAEQFEKWQKLREQSRPGGPGGEKKKRDADKN